MLVDHRGPNFNENRFMDIRLEVKTTTYTTWIGRVATVEVMVPCASQVLTTAGTRVHVPLGLPVTLLGHLGDLCVWWGSIIN